MGRKRLNSTTTPPGRPNRRPAGASVSNKRTNSPTNKAAKTSRKPAPKTERIIIPTGGTTKVFEVRTKAGRRPSTRKRPPLPASLAASSPPSYGERLVSVKRVPGSKIDYQTTLRSATFAFTYQDADGSYRIEHAKKLLSYPRRRGQQLKREQFLCQAGYSELADASKAITGMKFLDAVRWDFVDLPGHIFSHSHRAWAHKQMAGAIAVGLPKDAFAFATVLVAAVPDITCLSPKRLNELVEDTRVRVARAVRSTGAIVAYANGGFEIAEKNGFKKKYKVGRYVAAYQENHWPSHWPRHQIQSVSVLHVHFALFAHNGLKWIDRRTLSQAFKREFTLPHESYLTARKGLPTAVSAACTAGYLRKPPHKQNPQEFVQDALLRFVVPANRLWWEGFWSFERSCSPASRCGLDVLRRFILRDRQIETLELLGAAVGFATSSTRLPQKLRTHAEVLAEIRSKTARSRNIIRLWASFKQPPRRLTLPAPIAAPSAVHLPLLGRWPQGPPSTFPRRCFLCETLTPLRCVPAREGRPKLLGRRPLNSFA